MTDIDTDPRDLLDRVRGRLADAEAGVSAAEIAHAVREEVGVIGDGELLRMMRLLREELTGAGPLDPLLRLPGVTDVLVTAPDAVWIDRGTGLEKTTVTFADNTDVRRLAVRLASVCGRRLDDAQPYVDAFVPDPAGVGAGGGGARSGTSLRVHAMLSPPATHHVQISIRVLRPARWGLDDLIDAGFIPPAAAVLLRRIIAARLSFLVAGGTGSGKTTLLSALLGEVDPGERIVCIEDTPELAPAHPHVVTLSTRTANVEGAGEITQRDLVRQTLRMRPDRVVVGEIRGAEVVDLLAALNTGHDGGAGTVHANCVEDVPARMEALGSLGGLDREELRAQLGPAVQVVLGVERVHSNAGPTRCLASIGVLDKSTAAIVPAWSNSDTDTTSGRQMLDQMLVRRMGPTS